MKNRKLWMNVIVAAMFVGVPVFSHAQQNAPAVVPAGVDDEFVKGAAEGGLSEVTLGQLAQTNASNASVKQFGHQMVTDHGKANNELKALAQKKGWKLPNDTAGNVKQSELFLQSKKGAEFDKAYMKDMVSDHQKDIKDFEKCASSCSDAELKAWAAKTVPTLKHHLKMATASAKQVGALSSHAEKKSAEVESKPSAAKIAGQ